MTVRPARAGDVADVAALDRHLFGPDAWSTAQVEEELVGERRRAWVAGDPLVGYAVTLRVGDPVELVDLQRIAVRPDHRRRGLARSLLTAALADAADSGADRMLLEVSADNPGALAFYAAAGFTEIDRRRGYYRDGADAVVMQRPLGG